MRSAPASEGYDHAFKSTGQKAIARKWRQRMSINRIKQRRLRSTPPISGIPVLGFSSGTHTTRHKLSKAALWKRFLPDPAQTTMKTLRLRHEEYSRPPGRNNVVVLLVMFVSPGLYPILFVAANTGIFASSMTTANFLHPTLFFAMVMYVNIAVCFVRQQP